MATVQDFLIEQSDKTIKYDLEGFFVILHTKYYNTVDISFMDYFLSLVPKDGEFCVDHEKLQEYGVLNNIDRSSTVKRALDQYDLVEDEDYSISYVDKKDYSNGGNNKKMYKLTPHAFKLCLIRAKNSKIYTYYYLLLEKVLKHFQDYQYLYQQKIISMQSDKIDKQSINIDKQIGMLNDQKQLLENQASQIDDVLHAIAKISNDNKDLKEKIEDNNTEFNEKISTVINYLAEKSFTSTKNPRNVNKHHNFLVTKEDIDNKIILKLVAGQITHIDKYIKNMPIGESIVIDKFYNANGIDLRHNIQDEFQKMRNKFIIKYNGFHKQEIDEANGKIRLKVADHNMDKTNKKLYYIDEKLNYNYIKKSNISIICSKTKIIYTANDYISYDSIVDLIKSVNNITQKSPLTSDKE